MTDPLAAVETALVDADAHGKEGQRLRRRGEREDAASAYERAAESARMTASGFRESGREREAAIAERRATGYTLDAEAARFVPALAHLEADGQAAYERRLAEHPPMPPPWRRKQPTLFEAEAGR